MLTETDLKDTPSTAFFDPAKSARVLVIGIGNSGRRDDGLGWAFLDALEKQGLFTGELSYRYQLQIEDAELISRHPVVIFVDATTTATAKGFEWKKCLPNGQFSFSTHELSPETVLSLCHHLYGQGPRAFILAIQGYEWDLCEGLSEQAFRHLSRAVKDFAERYPVPLGTSAADIK